MDVIRGGIVGRAHGRDWRHTRLRLLTETAVPGRSVCEERAPLLNEKLFWSVTHSILLKEDKGKRFHD